MKIKAVILDIGGTLSPDNSWVTLTEKLGASIETLFEHLYDLRAGKTSEAQASKLVTKLWSDTGKANKSNILKIYDETQLHKESKSIINYLKTKYKVCVISGTTDLYVQIIAKMLNINDFYWNTEMFFDQNDRLLGLDYRVDQPTLKLDQFMEWAKKNNINPEETAVIGDGDSDIKLFEKLGLPILLITKYNIDELKKYAKYEINSLSELKAIL